MTADHAGRSWGLMVCVAGASGAYQRSGTERKRSFLKKRTKKLLRLKGGGEAGELSKIAKVFCFFSSEKKTLLP
jgi:hypothetical protein